MYQWGVIGGTGWMGAAMLAPALQRDVLNAEQVAVSNRSGEQWAAFPEIRVFSDSQALVEQCKHVVLSVRPGDFSDLKVCCKDQLVISIMAGVSVQQIQALTGATKIIRAMPNAAAEVGESYTPYYATASVTADEIAQAAQFFNGFGTCDRVSVEDDISYLVALTGSGHGTLAYFASALVDAGVKHGLEPALADRAVRQLMKGVGALISEEDNTVQETVKRVTEYGGTTCRLVETLANQRVNSCIEKALQASYDRAKSDMTRG